MSSIKQQFEQDGYYHAKGVFSPSEVAALEHDFDHIVDQITTGGNASTRWTGPAMDKIATKEMVVLHTHQVHEFSNVWLQALLHKRFLDITQEIVGPNIALHHTKLFQKPSENGAPFPMHQDWTYFPSYQDSMMAAIIWVSDATDEMGCLRVYPGSNKLGRVPESSGQIENPLLAEYPIENATVLEAKAGDVTYFHYFTLHGSMPNRSDKVRKSVLVQMLSGDDEIEEGNRHPNARLALRGWNATMTREKANKLH